MLLCANNYFLVFALGILVFAQNIQILRGDLDQFTDEEETLGCRIQGYIFFSFISAVYQAFALQVRISTIRRQINMIKR
jgi:hypothetical protein